MIQYDSEPCHPNTASLLHYKYHAMLLIGVAVSLRELCCGQRVVRHQTAASSNPSDMFVRPSVEDIKTCRTEMNDLLLVNWIMEPADENQSSGRKGGKRGLERLNEGGWGLLFYSCLEAMAHMRQPNPTGNGKPRGKGKTNKGNGSGGVRGGGVSGVQGLCVRWCSVGVVLIFLLLRSR